MYIGNFTPDDIEWMYGGVPGVIKSGEYKELEDKAANHVLTKFGAKGLVRMKWGENLEDKKKQSMAQYMKFWEYQVEMFNQHNELAKSEKRAYVRPTKELEEHADKLGFPLIMPWTMKRDGGQTDAQLKQSNADLEAQVNTLQQQVADLLKAMEKNNPLVMQPPSVKLEAAERGAEDPADEKKEKTAPKIEFVEPKEGEFGHVEQDLEVYINQFKDLKEEKLAEFVFANPGELDKWPDEAKQRLREKWAKVFGKKSVFPITL